MTSIIKEIERLQALEQEYNILQKQMAIIWNQLYPHNPAFRSVDNHNDIMNEINRLQQEAIIAERDSFFYKNAYGEMAGVWQSIWWQLLNHNPYSSNIENTGEQCALKEIKRLQDIENNQQSVPEKANATVEPGQMFFNKPTTDREWLINCLAAMKNCTSGAVNWDTYITKLENYTMLNEEQFAKPKDYGKLLAFADRISGIIWGGECAWSTLDNTEDDGLKTLSKAVQKTVNELNDKVKKEAVLLGKLRAANYTIDEYLDEAEDIWDEDDENDAEGIYVYEDEDYEDDEDQ